MKYMRLKKKTILEIMLIIVILFGSFYFLKDNIIYGIGKVYSFMGKEDLANVYYNKVIERYPEKDMAIKSAISQIKDILKHEDLGYFRNRIVINSYGSSTKGSGDVFYGSLEDINAKYNKIKQNYPQNILLDEYTLAVSMMNWFGGEGDKAISMLEDMEKIKNNELEDIKRLNLAAMYMNSGEINKGREILIKDINKKDKYEYLRRDMLSFIYFMDKEYMSFYEYKVEEILQINKIKSLYIEPIKDITDAVSDMDRYIKDEKDKNKIDNIVNGRITMDKKPLPYTMVYLKDVKDMGMDSGFIEYSDIYMDITNENGEFSIENVPKGQYTLSVSVDWQRAKGKQFNIKNNMIRVDEKNTELGNISFFESIKDVNITELEDGKIKFQWNYFKDKDIEKYIIYLGEVRKLEDGSERAIFSYMSKEIDGNSFILDIEKEKRNAMIGFFSYGSDGVDPYYILEPLYHKGEYAYKIVGYSGSNIVSDNLGLYSNRSYDKVYIDGNEWTEADRLVLDGNIDKAIELYESEVDKDKGNIHALKPLAALYYNGWKYDENTQELKGNDYIKAKKYLQLLDIEIGPNDTINNRLAYIYQYNNEYDKALEFYQDLAKNGYLYHYSSIADIYLYKGNWDKAIYYYNKYYNNNGGNSGITDLMMIYILKNDINALEDIGNKYSIRYYYADYNDVIKKYIQTYDAEEFSDFFKKINDGEIDEAEKLLQDNKDDISKFYRGIMILQDDISYEEKEDRYTEIYNLVKDSNIKMFMKYLGKSGLNTGFGDR